jgi:hypothetical protein
MIALYGRRDPATLTAGLNEIVSLAQGGDAGVVDALAEAGRWIGRGAALPSPKPRSSSTTSSIPST